MVQMLAPVISAARNTFKMLLSVDTIEWMKEQQQFDSNESKGNSPEQRKGESQNRIIEHQIDLCACRVDCGRPNHL